MVHTRTHTQKNRQMVRGNEQQNRTLVPHLRLKSKKKQPEIHKEKQEEMASLTSREESISKRQWYTLRSQDKN